MKKTLQVNIGGRKFNIDEDAYNMIRDYLDSLKAHFSEEGESAEEITGDIEARIAELFQERLTDSKQVITISDVQEVKTIMGNGGEMEIEGHTEKAYQEYDRRDYRRLFRDPDHYAIGGVASGLAAYFNIDTVWMRIAFLLLIFLNGLGILLYIILWIAVPKAQTTAEKLQMQGLPVNLSSIKTSFSNEYQRTKSSLRRSGGEELIRVIGNFFLIMLKVFAVFIGIIFVFAGSLLLSGLIMLLFGYGSLFGRNTLLHGWGFPDITGLFTGSPYHYILIICLMIIVLIPLAVLIYEGIKLIFNIKTRHKVLRAFTITAWFLALFLFISLAAADITKFAVETSNHMDTTIGEKEILYININDNSQENNVVTYDIFDYRFRYNKDNDLLFKEPLLNIDRIATGEPYIRITNNARKVRPEKADEYLSNINYHWEIKDTLITLDKYFSIKDQDIWMFPEVLINIYIPEGQEIVFSESVCPLLNSYYRYRYCNDSSFAGKTVVMTDNGLVSR